MKYKKIKNAIRKRKQGRMFAQNLSHFENYIERMQGDINARQSVLVPFTAVDTVVPLQAQPEAPPVRERRICLRCWTELPRGGSLISMLRKKCSNLK